MSGDGPNRVSNLEQRVQELTQQVERLEQRLDAQPSPDTVKWLVSQVQSGNHTQPTDPEEMTSLERYVQMPLEERADLLPVSEMRATLIFENWTEWAHSGPYGGEFMTTAQEKPATLRVLLRERDPTVNVDAGEELHHQQVYRAMRAVHRLTDGALEYDERHRTPDNTDSGTCHALKLEAPDEMPTLPR